MVSSCFLSECSPWTLVWRVPSWLMLCITQLPPWTKVCYIIIPHLDQTNGLVHPRVADITRWLTLTSPGLGPSQIYRALCGDVPVFWFFCEEILLLGRGCYSYIEDLEKKTTRDSLSISWGYEMKLLFFFLSVFLIMDYIKICFLFFVFFNGGR